MFTGGSVFAVVVMVVVAVVVVGGTNTGAVIMCAVRRMRGCLSDPTNNQKPSISTLTFFKKTRA